MEHKVLHRFIDLTCDQLFFRVKQIIFIILPILSLLWGCSKVERPHVVRGAFYYWRSSFEFTSKQRDYLDSLHVKRLYVKFFDVDWNPNSRVAQPIASIEFKDTIPQNMTVVPTVFITNRTLQHLTPRTVLELASNVVRKLKGTIAVDRMPDVREVQIDCDWTATTKDTYFRLLQTLKDILRGDSIQLSATVRLHQLTYKRTVGIPPIDRGVLMFYNMGDVDKPGTKNSILDVDIGRYYLERSGNYPVHLDIVLPLFRWGVHLRESKVVDLIHGMGESDMSDGESFQVIEKDLYRVIRSRYVCSTYVYKDDILRLEQVSIGQLSQAVELLKDHIKADTLIVAFYHLDTNTPERFHYENLRDLLASFRR
ncbi:MAG: hypothetical protein NTZ35_14940 [Ignavibacteriales bacterium]|nr:hypothetical protein [Ignavibacteriales bacterium]